MFGESNVETYITICKINSQWDLLYVSGLLSQIIPPSLFLTVPISLFSLSASPLLPCRWVHQYYLSKLHF